MTTFWMGSRWLITVNSISVFRHHPSKRSCLTRSRASSSGVASGARKTANVPCNQKGTVATPSQCVTPEEDEHLATLRGSGCKQRRGHAATHRFGVAQRVDVQVPGQPGSLELLALNLRLRRLTVGAEAFQHPLRAPHTASLQLEDKIHHRRCKRVWRPRLLACGDAECAGCGGTCKLRGR